ncbi:hypothetical protein AMTRI_Chr13g118060 [Amborella trichopoda]|uniref:Uncharacterized protein n=1 Tax=Amborella trichopoda TaxID=13333 RepID=W1P8N9_AMBTC|nr:uncharacterized protein LOC18432197 [Amborella trichopoda]ERN04044.1 hypothetical protein AMTR_s00079p00188510 [Amborella trichopoda]|eukprot:XP_006842369.1 uncharacterized protein LOC18432197 [Amborella trichopoda]
MATLTKFKILATQCAIAASPSRSPNPTIAPSKKTLRKLIKEKCKSSNGRLLRRGSRPRSPSISDSMPQNDSSRQKHGENAAILSRKLKDLFVSSPPICERKTEERASELALNQGSFSSPIFQLPINQAAMGRGSAPRGLPRIGSATRLRLLRRAWRPVLVSIPE